MKLIAFLILCFIIGLAIGSLISKCITPKDFRPTRNKNYFNAGSIMPVIQSILKR